jgi:DNA-binding CsgD family transcriptional regulator
VDIRRETVQLEIRGLERLSPRERQVVALKETGLGNDAVARRLHLKPGTVATLYNRANIVDLTLNTSIGLIVLGIGLWQLWRNQS